MAHIDLHLHTTFSDGSLSPEAVVAEAAERDVRLIAITDHDELDGIVPAQVAGRPLGVEVMCGVEINTTVGREEVHILGYGFPVDSPVLREGLQQLRAARLERAQLMLERLRKLGYPLDAQRVLAISGSGSIGRPHIARALLQEGYVTSVRDAFDRLLGQRCPAYIPRAQYRPEMAIALIRRSDGFAVLAHPGKLGDPIRIIQQMVNAGLQGMEVYHSDHSSAVTTRMLQLANRYGLIITGGSDSHGPGVARTVSIGAVPVPDAVGQAVLAIVQRLTGEQSPQGLQTGKTVVEQAAIT